MKLKENEILIYKGIILDLNLNFNLIKTLSVLLNYADDKGRCYPTIKNISDELGKGITQTKQYINELVKSGYITKETRKKADGTNTSNLYTILLNNLKQAENKPKTSQKQTLKSKLRELKEDIENNAILTEKQAEKPVKYTSRKTDHKEYKYNNYIYNSKSKSLKQVRPRLAELKELENLEKDKSIPVDRDALQTMKSVFYSVCTCNLDKYTINQKQISKQSIINKIKSLSIYDYKNIVNAITGKEIRHKYSYIINTLWNYGTNQEQKNSTWNLSQKQDYDFELLESL